MRWNSSIFNNSPFNFTNKLIKINEIIIKEINDGVFKKI